MKKALIKMRNISVALASVRTSLKVQEVINKNYRNLITEAWDKPELDGDVATWSQNLRHGRKAVRGYQTALHELKHGLRDYNKRYDRAMRREQE